MDEPKIINLGDALKQSVASAEAKRGTVDIKALRWQEIDARLGNYEDCAADLVRQAAEEFTGASLPIADILGWSRIDTERTAFLVGDTVWTVTMDHDCDGSSVVRVEVVRA